MAKSKTASFSPDTYQEGGGLLDNVDVTWKEVRFEMWDYNKTAPESPALKIVMGLESGEDAEQYWSCGKAEDWKPSKDGKTLEAIGKASGINKSSNVAILLKSLVDAGFPKDKMGGDDCTIFEGLECHMIRIPGPKRTGLVPKKRADGREFEPTVLVVDNIISLPWEGKGAGKAKSGEGDDVKEKAQEVALGILGDNPKGLPKDKLVSKAFKVLNDEKSPLRNDVVEKLQDQEFLESIGLSVDKKGNVTME